MTLQNFSNSGWKNKSWKKNRPRALKLKRARDSWHGKKEGGIFPAIPRKKLLAIAASLFGLLLVFGVAGVFFLTKNLPDPNRLMDRQIAQSTKIYDRTGQTILYEIHGDEKRTIVNLNELPEYVRWATIVVEDKDFYKHKGFSFFAIFRTVATNVLFGKKAGGSTLTQQFIKNAVLTNEKTYTRKIKELILAYRLEKKFSKDEILQMYFNEIPYGSTAYGIEAASQKYFGKSARKITLPEAAILAAIPQAPSRYSPYGPNKQLLAERQHYIIDLMAKYGYIEKDQAEIYKNMPIKFKEPSDNIMAPHFVMYVKEILADKYGEKTIEQDGLKIYTTLDLYKQKAAEEAIKAQVEKNEKSYKASNAAMVSIDPKTGQILAMVGSKDYFDEKIDGQVNITTSLRQPGSSIKPIVYAAAFLKGYTPNTVLYDVTTNFSTDPSKPYIPHNYNGKDNGPVTMRKSLAGSLNIPAVKTIYLAGIDNVLTLAKSLGYTSLNDKNRFGLSLVLGGGEVRLLEHANAYSAFARDGELHPISALLKIEDKNGKVLEEFQDKKTTPLDSNVARMINDVLSDNPSRAFIFGDKNWLTLPSRPVAAKTGTTNDNRDAWAIGYTPSLVTGVWVGNNDNTPMKKGADGSVVAAPIWNGYMKKVLGDTPSESFKKPEIKTTGKAVLDGNVGGENMVKIDKASGLLATENTPPELIEEKAFRQAHCILYYIDKNNPTGPSPKNPAEDPQFSLWETPILEWAAKNNISTSSPPTASDNLHVPENKPTFSITSPQNKSSITSPNLTVTIEATAPRGINRAEYSLDNNLVFVASAFPFNLEKNISFLKNGFHSLSVKVCDDVSNCSSQNLELNLLLDREQSFGEIGIDLLGPTDGMAAATSSFPLSISGALSNYEQAAKASFYYVNAEKKAVLLSTIAPIISPSISSQWSSSPPPGTYKIFAEAVGWNGQSAKSKEINIIIK